MTSLQSRFAVVSLEDSANHLAMGGWFQVELAFGVCVGDRGDDAQQAVQDLDALAVVAECVENIPKCDYATSYDAFVTFKLPRSSACLAGQLEVDFDMLQAIMVDEANTDAASTAWVCSTPRPVTSFY